MSQEFLHGTGMNARYYEKWVSMRLRNQSSEIFLRQELRLIALILEQNKLPPEARAKSK